MFEPFSLILFTPFYFKNGNSAKDKYFITLAVEDDNIVFASLPTSKDFVPDDILKHGCINLPKDCISCYVYEKEVVIGKNGFYFPRNTFLYFSQIQTFSKEKLDEIYEIEGVDFVVIDELTEIETKNLKSCLLDSNFVRKRIQKLL